MNNRIMLSVFCDQTFTEIEFTNDINQPVLVQDFNKTHVYVINFQVANRMTFLIDYWSNDILEYFDGICKFILWQKHSFSPVKFILEKISDLVLLLYYIIILYNYLFSL